VARTLSSFAVGLLFGLGLLVSQMANPAKVLAFLDVFGPWDASLAFVMVGAIAASSLGYTIAKRRGVPMLATKLDIPNRRDLDPKLFIGATIFGVGWGLAGLCPGPSLTLVSLGMWQASVFVAAMMFGMLLFRMLPTSGSQLDAKPSSQGADA
jgi:uncharacterized membrane protein YedE/YeeE